MIGCQKNKIQFKCHDSTALTFKKYIICCRYQNPKSKPGRRAFYFEEITKLWSRNLVTHPTITKSNGRRGGPSQSGKRVGPGPFLFALASQRSCFLGDRCLVRKRQKSIATSSKCNATFPLGHGIVAFGVYTIERDNEDGYGFKLFDFDFNEEQINGKSNYLIYCGDDDALRINQSL